MLANMELVMNHLDKALIAVHCSHTYSNLQQTALSPHPLHNISPYCYSQRNPSPPQASNLPSSQVTLLFK